MVELNFIDIASWEATLDMSKVPDCAGVVIKATEGRGYQNPAYPQQVKQARSLGLLVGHYHFVSFGNTPEQEAENFHATISKHFQRGDILVVDWEVADANMPVDHIAWCSRLVDLIREKTGIIPVMYMNAYTASRWNWGYVSQSCPLWVAYYPPIQPTEWARPTFTGAYNLNPWKVVAWQYSEDGMYGGHDVDLNVFYGSPDDWRLLGGLEPKPVTPPSTNDDTEVVVEDQEPEPAPAPKPTTRKPSRRRGQAKKVSSDDL